MIYEQNLILDEFELNEHSIFPSHEVPDTTPLQQFIFPLRSIYDFVPVGHFLGTLT